MALLLSHLGASSLGSKSSWLVLSLLFGCAGAVSLHPCELPPVSNGAKLTTITHDGVSRSWYTYVPASVADAHQAVVPLVVDLHGIYGCVTKEITRWLSKAEEFGFILVSIRVDPTTLLPLRLLLNATSMGAWLRLRWAPSKIRRWAAGHPRRTVVMTQTDPTTRAHTAQICGCVHLCV